MKPTKVHPSKIPIWVKILDLPWELWNRECISRIASTIGRPIHVDQATAKKTKTSHARVCVEIDANLELPDDVTITVGGERVVVPIQYQVLPPMCAKCKVFGHACRITPPVNIQAEPPVDDRKRESNTPVVQPLEISIEKEEVHIANTANLPVEEWQIIGKAAALKVGGITALEAVTKFVPIHTNTALGGQDDGVFSDDDTLSEPLDGEIEVNDVYVPPKVDSVVPSELHSDLAVPTTSQQPIVEGNSGGQEGNAPGENSEDGEPQTPKFRDPTPDIIATSGGSSKASRTKKKGSRNGSKRKGKT